MFIIIGVRFSMKYKVILAAKIGKSYFGEQESKHVERYKCHTEFSGHLSFVWVSYYCCNKLPIIWWLKTT